MTSKEIFLKFIGGYRCSRQEYLIAQEFLSANSGVRDIYDSQMQIIAKSLINNLKRSELHFLTAANKHGLTKEEALSIIDTYSSKQLSR